jgi:acyl-CoA synthetase (AMP-forming)/AMP-acid ligase II
VELHLVRGDLSLAEVGETGEIVLAGPTLMRGYYRDPDATAHKTSKWGFHTGDFAYADADGFLFYEGRSDDVFKCAGEKVSAKEVEDAVLEHPGILEAAVTAHEDPLLGQVPVVHVVVRAEGAPTEEDLRAFCGRRLSRHKVPRRVFFVSALDKTPTGKIQKFRLREKEAVR